ncbi:MAG: T9SS type A sorting domain-containing protein [Bacteroidota bacterium]|nr:T9SS type A sorting domain-containing protein [Bacteroidota bacterium]
MKTKTTVIEKLLTILSRTIKKNWIIPLFILFTCTSLNLFAADYYWVNGTGDWSDYETHWATSSGGSTMHTSVPGQVDDVFFDANSFASANATVNIDMEATFHSMDWTGATNTPDIIGSNNMNIYGSLTFISGMTASYSGTMNFLSDNAGNTLNFATDSVFFNSIQFNGAGEWTFLSDMDIAHVWGGLSVLKGTFNTNGYDLSVSWFDSWSTDNRIINLDSSTITCQNLNLWNLSTLDFNAGTSRINITNSWLDGMGLTYYDVSFPMQWIGEVQINGNNTFNTLYLNDTSVTGVVFQDGNTNTIYDIKFGATCANRKTVRSMTDGQTATIKKITGTVQEDYLNIKDIEVIGGANFITDNGVDMGNVTNWTINSASPADYYWVGGTGNWSDPDHWGASSGQSYPTGNTCVPTDVDDVIFDVNSFTASGQVVTVDDIAFCNSMDWTGVANNPDLTSVWPSELNIYGSLTLDPAMSVSYSSSIYFRSSDPGNTITTAGHSLNSAIYFYGTGDWTLQDNLNGSYIYLNQGHFITNNYNVNGSAFYSSTTMNRQLDLGSSMLNFTGSWLIYDGTNMSLNSGTSTIDINGNVFRGAGFTYNDVNVNYVNYTTIYASNIFNVLNVAGYGGLKLESGKTQTLNDLIVSGDCSNIKTIRSPTDGDSATISKSAGTVTVDYVALQDITATGGATFNANNSMDNGNVTGWSFTFLPSTDYYWINGTGNWSDPTHWSLASGGAPNSGGCVPTQVDNVYFDANSFSGAFETMTVDVNASCTDMDWSAAPINANMAGNNTLSVYGSFDISEVTNYSYVGPLYFKSDNTGNMINTGGVTFNHNVYFDGDGDWTLQDDLLTNSANYENIFFIKGSLITNNFDVTTSYFYSYSGENRQLSLGSSVITVYSWNINNGTNLTIAPGTSTINASRARFYGGSQAYYDVNLTSNVVVKIYGNNDFNDLDISNASQIKFEGGMTQTFNSLIIPSGTDCNNYFDIGTLNAGAVAHLSMPAGIFNGNWLRITDLTAGGGGTFNANNSLGIGNVSGWNITPPTPVTLYWVGDGGDWSDPNHWSLTSGGASYGCIPNNQDNVFFDANSFSTSGQIVNVDQDAYCKNMDWTGVTNTPDISGWSEINVNGSLTLVPAMINSFGVTFNLCSSISGNTITSAGHTLNSLVFSGAGEYTLQDNVSLSSNFVFDNGTLNTNDMDITINSSSFVSNSSNTRTLNMGASTITASSWMINDTANLSLNTGTSEIIISNNPWQFDGGGATYNDVIIYPNTWGAIYMYSSNTFNNLIIQPGADIMFEPGKIQYTTNFVATGSEGQLIDLYTMVSGETAEINQTVGEFCGDYLNIQDMVAFGNTFYAGEYSNDLGNNTGWTFSGVEANNQYPAAICEDFTGSGTVAGIDLTLLENTIDGGNGYIHTWYEDDILTILVPDPTNVTVSDGQIFYDQVDNGTCTNVAEVIYTVMPLPTLSFVTNDVTCNGDADGDIDLTANGGNPPYSYNWSTTETAEDISGLSSGWYTVTVINSLGCQAIDSVEIYEPSVLTILVDSIYDISCNGLTDGAVYTTAAGGTGAYSYNWTNTGQTTDDITALAANTYDVTVTDMNGCMAATTSTVNEPSLLTITVDSIYDVSCNGLSDGEVFTTAAGGTGAYSYNWTNTGQTTDDITALAANTYDVTVTDMNGCTAATTSTVNEPSLLTITVDSIHDVSCYGFSDGNIFTTAAGGTGAYSYSWTNTGQTTGDITALPANTYDVTVTDINGCTASIIGTINEPSEISLSFDTDSATCGFADGQATVYPTGGSGVYSYLWDVNAGDQVTQTATGLSSGIYSVTVNDGACDAIGNVAVSEIGGPDITVTADTTICVGDTVILVASGADSFVWTSEQDTVLNDSVVAHPDSTIMYNVQGTTGGCSVFEAVTVNVDYPVSVDLGLDTVLCADQSIILDAGGGFDAYLWSDGSVTQTVMVDSTGVGLNDVEYSVTVTNGACESYDTVLITFEICTNITDSKNELDINIYPNPTKATFYVDVNYLSENLNVFVFDTQGKLIYRDIIVSDNSQDKRFNFEIYKKGVYFIRLLNDNVNYLQKIVVVD